MKNVLIIGATSELAEAIAKKYASKGWNLTLAAVETDQLENLVEEIASCATAPVHSALFDAMDPDGHASFYESLPAKPDVVLCSFGYLGDQVAARTDIDEVRNTIEINLTGAISILNIIAEDFERRGHGKIAAMSSVAGERGKQGNYIYGSAKGALTAYLSGLRNHLTKSGVHVMTIIPGFCRTRKVIVEDIPDWLIAEPEEVADAVYSGLQKKKNVVYVRGVWRWIMALVRHMPEPLFQRLAYTRYHY